VDFVKFDLEGSEPAALLGSANLLRNAKTGMKMLIEFTPSLIREFGSSPEKEIEILWSYGFTLYIFEENKQLQKLENLEKLMGDLEKKKGTNILCLHN
jgi:hypothetical protein